MIEQDMKAYLDKVDSYIYKSINLIEQSSRIYGQYIDGSGFKPELIINLKELLEKFRKIYFDIGDYTIDDLAPDPFQDLDSSAHAFISVCDNCIIFLTQLEEKSGSVLPFL
ncbi:MAG: hypothetical protein PHD17_08885 [Methanothrix soehngenii]|jgi:hypothetical protein|nr:hypothetical protein [Methanothrix soehngenii]MDD3974788.1 hypothetical protein [Methanothrix soehngenii]